MLARRSLEETPEVKSYVNNGDAKTPPGVQTLVASRRHTPRRDRHRGATARDKLETKNAPALGEEGGGGGGGGGGVGSRR